MLERICETVVAEMQHDAQAVIASPRPPLERLHALLQGGVLAICATRYRSYYAIMLMDESALPPEMRARLRVWSAGAHR